MHFINGKWVEGEGKSFASENPSTSETIWQGNAANAAQVEAAVQAAHAAFSFWSQKPFRDRIEICAAFTASIEADKETLATLISAESGKLLWDAKGEAAAVVGKLAASKDAYAERTPEENITELQGFNAVVRHRPHGVMAVLGPYNFPAHIPNGHIIPALIAGNTVVFKPSELTPKVAEWMVQKWEAAGLPAGVLNLVQGETDTAIALAKCSINGLLFTGSSVTGKLLHQQFGGRPEVILALELGGNNPLIVHEVADHAAAAYEIIQSAYLSSGQRCTCARRLIMVDTAENHAMLQKLTKMVNALQVGLPSDSVAAFVGPLIRSAEVERVLTAQNAHESAGAKVLCRAEKRHESAPLVSPSLIDVTARYRAGELPDEEIFGPLLQLIWAKDLTEAIEIANDTSYGLSAGLLSDDPEHFRIARQSLKSGLFNFNRQTTGASGRAPFGGVGLSGNHRPAGYYSADYCAYPVASMEVERLALPETLAQGVVLPA